MCILARGRGCGASGSYGVMEYIQFNAVTYSRHGFELDCYLSLLALLVE